MVEMQRLCKQPLQSTKKPTLRVAVWAVLLGGVTV